MKDRWTYKSSYDSEISERREGDECNRMEKVVGEREMKKNNKLVWGREGDKTRGGRRYGLTVMYEVIDETAWVFPQNCSLKHPHHGCHPPHTHTYCTYSCKSNINSRSGF